jgi:hypothetical protein
MALWHKEDDPPFLPEVKQPLLRALESRRRVHCMAEEASQTQEEGVGRATWVLWWSRGMKEGKQRSARHRARQQANGQLL